MTDTHEYNYVVELRDANITNDTTNILEQVNFKLAPAEFVYLIGKTGSGKSSLLRSLYVDTKITSGKAVVLGHDLTNINRKELPTLRRKLGLVFQEFQLFHEWTVARNLAYVLSVTGWRDKSKMEKRIRDVLLAVELEHKTKSRVHDLSGGEQQRLAIARSILNNPSLIIADEPTGNLDPETSDSIFYLLRQITLSFGTSILVATHDHRLIEKFPARVFKCQNKRLIEV